MKKLSRMAIDIERGSETDIESTSRRAWLKNATLVSASGLYLVACGKSDLRANSESPSMPAPKSATVEDGGLLNAALALEHEAIALYTAAAGLPFMQTAAAAPILAIAGTFLQHHTSHRDGLISTINVMKAQNPGVAEPVVSLSAGDYLAPVAAKLTDIKNVLRLASKKEMEACKAYIGLISSFKDPNLAKTSGLLGGDEAAHYGALRAALFAVIQDTDIIAQTVVPSAFPTGFTQTF